MPKKKTLAQAALALGAGTAFILGGYLVYQKSQSPAVARGQRAKRSLVKRKTARALAKAATKDIEQQRRVLDRVSKFLSHEGAPTKEELDALFDEAAGDDGKISLEEFTMVVRAPLMHNVSQLVRKSVEDVTQLATGAAADAELDEGALELALKIQDGIPKIKAGIPALSASMFKALDKDNSGFLDKSEFQAALGMFDCFSDPAWLRGQPTPENLSKMRPAFELLFNTANVSGDGQLNIADTQALLREASDFAFGFASSVVHLVGDSVSGTVLTKLVAQPFRKALEELDTDGDGTIDLQEMHLESRVGGIVATFREHMSPKLGSSDLVNAPMVAQDLLQRQALTDLITGVTGAREHLSLSDKARAGVAGGISQSSFVRACVASADKQHKSSLELVESALEATAAPSAVTSMVRKLHEIVSNKSMLDKSVSLGAAQHKIYSAVYDLCDLNGDGVISWDEVSAWQEIQKAITGDPSANDKKTAEAIFSIIDKDGNGEVDQSEVEFLVHKLGVFGAAVAEGTLQVAQTFVRAGINLITDADYQDLVQQNLAGNDTLTEEQKASIVEALRAATTAMAQEPTQDPSSRTGELKDQIALGGSVKKGLTVDQAWAMLMAAWPGAKDAAAAQERSANASV